MDVMQARWMRWIHILVIWATIGLFPVLAADAETLLDVVKDVVKQDPRSGTWTPEQQRQVEKGALDQIQDRFELFAGCSPVGVTVEKLSDDGKKIGLTVGDLQAAIESRLRAARIYNANKPAVPYLRIVVVVQGPSFAATVSFRKLLVDQTHTQLPGPATTWVGGYVGTHGSRGHEAGHFILSSLSQVMDRFIAEYLEINDSACQYQ